MHRHNVAQNSAGELVQPYGLNSAPKGKYGGSRQDRPYGGFGSGRRRPLIDVPPPVPVSSLKPVVQLRCTYNLEILFICSNIYFITGLDIMKIFSPAKII